MKARYEELRENVIHATYKPLFGIVVKKSFQTSTTENKVVQLLMSLKLRSLQRKIDIIETALEALKKYDFELYDLVKEKYFAAMPESEICKKHDFSKTKLKRRIDEALSFIAREFKKLDS